MSRLDLSVRSEIWPLAQAFVIARGAKTATQVVVAEIAQDGVVGRGEAVPYARYGESVASVLAEIEDARDMVQADAGRVALRGLMTPGAALNVIDCALWDLRAKQAGVRAWTLAGLPEPAPVETCYTLSLDRPEAMGAAARAHSDRPLLKLKIGAADDLARVEAVRAGAPRARLVVDANEGLNFDDLRRLAPDFAKLGVALIEQPLKAAEDAELEGWESPVPLCADESLHTRRELADCARRYSHINIKLDKTGGLTEALALAAEAKARGLSIMAGCMVATSLAMAPALLIAQQAAVVDLDGPLLLAKDRENGLRYEGALVHPPSAALWG